MTETPNSGLGMTGGDVVRFWNDCAGSYSAMMQGDIPARVVGYLSDRGILSPDVDVLEIGSGPGTYSIPLASASRSVACLDSSQRMLDRLSASASLQGIPNITPVLGDWNSFDPPGEYGLCIATLCPGSGSPDSIMRMERASDGWCALVSWEINHGDDMTEMVWKRLGKDYDFSVRKSTRAFDWLKDNGRDPMMERFHARIVTDIPVDELAARESEVFSAYGVDSDVDGIVRDLVGGDSLHFNNVNTMRLIVWRSPPDN